MKEEDCGEEAQARLCLVLAAGHTLPFYKLFNLVMLYLIPLQLSLGLA